MTCMLCGVDYAHVGEAMNWVCSHCQAKTQDPGKVLINGKWVYVDEPAACDVKAEIQGEGVSATEATDRVRGSLGSIGKKYDIGKPRMDLIPFEALEEIAKVLNYGAKKYSPNNWKRVDDARSRYEAALLRHYAAYQRGETNDSESGLSHLAHLGCNALFLIWIDLQRTKRS